MKRPIIVTPKKGLDLRFNMDVSTRIKSYNVFKLFTATLLHNQDLEYNNIEKKDACLTFVSFELY